MNKILSAVQYASGIHQYDKRKYSGERYIYHCLRVMNNVMLAFMEEKYVLAAICHDIIEDHPEPTPEIAYANLVEVIGEKATIIVGELTNRYTSEQYPKMNRAERKKREVQRLAACSNQVKLIKMYDRLDNLQSFDFKELVVMEPKERKRAIEFGRIYAKESIALFETIGGAYPYLSEKGINLAKTLL